MTRGAGPIGWDDARTARAYEAFASEHTRYDDANRELVAHAGLVGHERVLDVGAGTGRTTERVLDHLHRDGRVVCLEPARAMRELGQRRIADARVSWVASLADANGPFDRVLCGAAFWLLGAPEEACAALAARLAPGGSLVFDLPSLYLGEPDAPGGGEDPLLLRLPAEIAQGRVPNAEPVAALDAARVEAALAAAGLAFERWTFSLRLSQEALRDWMKIPVITDALLADLDVEDRDARIDEAFARCDAGSWRWERWTGWTAWPGG